MVSSKNTYMSSIIRTEQVIYIGIYIHIHICMQRQLIKEGMNLKETRRGHLGGLGGEK